MTILNIHKRWGDDPYGIEADEEAVKKAVEELEEEYSDVTPEDEQDTDDRADFILNGLESRGFEFVNVGVVDIYV